MQVVVFSEVKWGYLRTRKRFLIERLPGDWPVLFLEPVNLQAGSAWRPQREGRVTVATLPALKPATTVPLLNRLLDRRLFRDLVNLLVALWVRLLLAAWGGGARPRVIVIANVLAIPVARRLPRDLLVYDCNDDPTGFRTSPAWVGGYLDETLRAADLVVSCSRSLGRRLQRRVERPVEVIGNGVEFERFAQPVDATRVLPALRAAPRPRVGYAGAISNWFDFELVAAVAAAHPAVPVVLMGPVAPDVAARAAALAAQHRNVMLTGAVPYEDLPHQVGSLDVCLIPFLVGGETDVLNPNKLYEYLAAGRTVVTLDYSEDVREFAGSVRLARDRDDFVAQVGAALAAPADAGRLQELARRHSWQARAAAFAALVRGRLVAPGAEER